MSHEATAVIEDTTDFLDAIVADAIEDSPLDELDAFIAEQEAKPAVIDEEDVADVEAAISLEEAKAASYEEQEAEPEREPIAKVEPAPKVKTSAGGAKQPSAALRARLGANVYSTVLINEDDVDLDESALKARVDDYLEGFDGLAKKVGEKVVNFYCALAGNAQLSNYTRIALDLLKEKGEIQVSDIRNTFLDQPYTPGTSSSQASQMNLMLPAVGIAKKIGNTLQFNADSPVAELLF